MCGCYWPLLTTVVDVLVLAVGSSGRGKGVVQATIDNTGVEDGGGAGENVIGRAKGGRMELAGCGGVLLLEQPQHTDMV